MRDIVSPLMGLRSPFGGRVDPYKAAGFRPQLVADMTRDYYRSTSRQTFDDLFTHSRLGNATMVDSDGLLKWGPHNLLKYSGDLTNAAWSKLNNGTGSAPVVTSGQSDPVGGNAAFRVQASRTGAGYSILQQTLSGLPVSVDYTHKVWMKSNTGVSQEVYFRGPSTGVVTVTTSWQEFETEEAHSGETYLTVGTRDTETTDLDVDVLVYAPHVYRSDLGGMAPVPADARVAGSTTYVPTTSTAKYLPRRHNHVYNGTAWVDAGTLIETEARTNLITYSQDFTDASWTKSNTGTLAVDATGPDGETSAVTLVDSGAGGTGEVFVYRNVTVSTSSVYTLSVFAKAGQLSHVAFQLNSFSTPVTDTNAWFNISTGTVGTVEPGFDGGAKIEDVGNGWFRCSATFTTDAADTSGQVIILCSDGDNDKVVDLDGTSSILIYGAQLEAGSTPSSYCPSNGAASTRAADTNGLTIPAYSTTRTTGSELVVNGGFDTDVSGWSGRNANTLLSAVSGQLQVETGAAEYAYAYQSLSASPGHVYLLTYDYDIVSGGGRVYVGDAQGTLGYGDSGNFTGSGSGQIIFVAGDTTPTISFLQTTGTAGLIARYDNISVKEAARIAPWPTPRVIGTNLDDDFSSYADQAAAEAAGYVFTGCTFDAANDQVDFSGVSANLRFDTAYTADDTAGRVYKATVTVSNYVSGILSLQDAFSTVATVPASNGTHEFIFVKSAVNSNVRVSTTNFTGSIDNISVKEIDPLVVAIQVSGRMTYADTGVDEEVVFFRWYNNSNSRIYDRVYTVGGDGGGFVTRQVESGTGDQSYSADEFSPGINQAFNIASYHGSTFINGAVGGTALTADTTPVSLPDLEDTDLYVGYDFMGNIEEVRIWVGGITDVTSGNLLISEASS